MITLAWFLAASVITGAALLYLRNTDAKRARVFKADVRVSNRITRLAIGLAVWAPAPALMWFGQYNAFLCWLGGLLVYGWLFAARKPLSAKDKGHQDADEADLNDLAA